MSETAVLRSARTDSEAVSSVSAFNVEFVRDWNLALSRWDSPGGGTCFQHWPWLEAWYGAFDAVSPLIAIVSDKATRRGVALIPLICREHRGVRLAEFADLDVTDYNAPILAADAPGDVEGMRAICRALVAALRRLPDRPDLLRMQKMPAEIQGRPNPLVLRGRIGSSSLNGNMIEVGDDFEAYRASIKRKELLRLWRVFGRLPGARFRLAATVDEALLLLDTTDRQQRERMKELGLPFVLDDGCRGRFYRNLIDRGFGEGYVVASALMCDDGIVATAFGIRRGTSVTLLRTSFGGKRWSSCAPGLLVIERTMAALHEQGVRHFDLSVGNYDYKRRFGAVPLPLTDVSIALSWRGVPYMLRDRLAQLLRRYPPLAAGVARVWGKRPR